jgi:hypothetical protein
MKTFRNRFLGMALVGLILGGCSQMATFEDADLMNEQAAAEKAGFKLDPFGISSGENSAVYSDDACQTQCITEDPNTWFYLNGREYFNPVIWIDYKVWQTPTRIFYEFKIGASNQGNHSIASYSVDNGASVANTGKTFTVDYPLPANWIGCDLVSRKFNITRTGGGGGATGVEITVDYNLIPICDDDVVNEVCTEAFRYERDDQDMNIITFYYTPSRDKADAEIQFTLPQVTAYEPLDGKTYSTFGNWGNQNASSGIRWNGSLSCGVEISFKLKFTPISCTNSNNLPANMVANFVVKDMGGNKLNGPPIEGACNN